MSGTEQKDAVRDIFYAALEAVDPYQAVKSHAEMVTSFFRSGRFHKIILISFGKAAYPMTRALIDHARDAIISGMVITKYGHTGRDALPDRIVVREAGHPVPDLKGYAATKQAMAMVARGDPRTLVTCLISGGGSALFVAPYGDVTLAEKQEVTRLLLKGGAGINEINAVRKHISAVKGGRLTGLIHPGKTLSLILSDVIGDRLDVIASGPTAPDNTTYADACEVIAKYGLVEETPRSVLTLLRRGTEGKEPETPKEGNPIFAGVDNIIVGNNKMATNTAKEKAEALGYSSEVLSTEIEGEARTVARRLADRAKKRLEVLRSAEGPGGREGCLISGGEPTVTVTGKGLGGRNTELALAFAMEIEGVEGITFLSAGTDGTDGPTDAAGAIVDGSTVTRARELGLDPEWYLNNNDSYNFFKQSGGLFMTGPTGTNVMDLHITLIRRPSDSL